MDSQLRKHAKSFRCKEARRLWETCRELNRLSGFTKFNVDHVVDVRVGGKDYVENLWIVPAEWNHRAPVKGLDMIRFIQSWIEKNGRVCFAIPKALAVIEFNQMWEEYSKHYGYRANEPVTKIIHLESLGRFEQELGFSLESWCRRECIGR